VPSFNRSASPPGQQPQLGYIEHAAGGEREFNAASLRGREARLLDASLDEEQSLELLLERRATAQRLHGA
jgi:hypothetical protein